MIILHIASLSMMLVSSYRPPACDFSKFKEVLVLLSEKIQHIADSWSVVITGDFNLPHIDWANCSLNEKDTCSFLNDVEGQGDTKTLRDTTNALLNFVNKNLFLPVLS